MSRPPSPAYRIERDIRWLTVRRDALRKRLGRLGPFLNGSLVLIERTCGNKEHCHCQRGRKHANWFLSYSDKSQTKMVYIPVDLEKDAEVWSKTYREVKDLIREISDLQRSIIRRHVQERDRKRKR